MIMDQHTFSIAVQRSFRGEFFSFQELVIDQLVIDRYLVIAGLVPVLVNHSYFQSVIDLQHFKIVNLR